MAGEGMSAQVFEGLSTPSLSVHAGFLHTQVHMSTPPVPDVLLPVKAFVEGHASAAAFADHLYTSEALEQLLRSAAPIPPYSTSSVHNLFQYLIELNFNREHEVQNAQDVLSTWLTDMGIAHAKSEVLAIRAALLRQVQPKWLNLDPDEFSDLLGEAGNRQGPMLSHWLKTQILERFRYTKRPPRWLQSPHWLRCEGRPLVFLGQLAAEGLFHDDAQVYVFLDPATGEIKTIVQLA